jgi:hypothetical protein
MGGTNLTPLLVEALATLALLVCVELESLAPNSVG